MNIPKKSSVDVSQSVMHEIEEKKIKMRSRLFFVAQKIGLESILAVSIFGGALLVSITLYFFKKTNVLKYLSFGFPGLKVILATLPYDYIALFLIALLVANFIVRRIDAMDGKRLPTRVTSLSLLVIIFFIGSFFAVMGIEQIIKGWSKNKVSRDIAIEGKIVDISNNIINIQAEDGTNVRIILRSDYRFPFAADYAQGKILRAIGKKDIDDKNAFDADEILCCDEE